MRSVWGWLCQTHQRRGLLISTPSGKPDTRSVERTYTLAEVQQLYAAAIKEGYDKRRAEEIASMSPDAVAGLIGHLEQVAELENTTPSQLIDRIAETMHEMDEEQAEEPTPVLDTPSYDDDEDFVAAGHTRRTMPMFDARGNNRDGGQSPR